MPAELDYIDHLAGDSARFAAALRDSPPDVAVATCPDWNADDLLWHLAEVQWYWGTIVREKITETARANEIDHPSRPADREALLAFYERRAATSQRRSPRRRPTRRPGRGPTSRRWVSSCGGRHTRR